MKSFLGIISVGVEIPWLNLEKLAMQSIMSCLRPKRVDKTNKEDPKMISDLTVAKGVQDQKL